MSTDSPSVRLDMTRTVMAIKGYLDSRQGELIDTVIAIPFTLAEWYGIWMSLQSEIAQTNAAAQALNPTDGSEGAAPRGQPASAAPSDEKGRPMTYWGGLEKRHDDKQERSPWDFLGSPPVTDEEWKALVERAREEGFLAGKMSALSATGTIQQDADRWRKCLEVGFPVRNQSAHSAGLRWTIDGKYFGADPQECIDQSICATDSGRD